MNRVSGRSHDGRLRSPFAWAAAEDRDSSETMILKDDSGSSRFADKTGFAAIRGTCRTLKEERIRVTVWKTIGLTALCLAVAANHSRGEAQPAAAHFASPQSASAPTAAGKPLLVVDGKHFRDRDGRVVLLRGVNLSGGSKVPPFLPVRSLSDLDVLPGYGFNVIRLGFIWEAFEPSPGDYRFDYLAMMRQVADAAWQRGLFVIIDLHQDGFSRYTAYGAGDGFPSWACSSRAAMSTPNNGPCSKYWPILMTLDPAVHRSFADFYANVDGRRNRYLAMLDHLSRAFASCPGVIGYDLLNEPWGREREELSSLHADAARVVRAHDPSAIMFIEGHVSTNYGMQTKLARPTFGNFAYAPHFYDPITILRNGWRGRPVVIRFAFKHMTAKAQEWNVPLFLGEFGISSSARASNKYVAKLYDNLDDSLASGAQWNYTPTWSEDDKDGWNAENYNILNSDGSPRDNFQARPYPIATAGTPLKFAFEKAKHSDQFHRLSYVWQHNPSLGATEIFLPETLFPAASTYFETHGDDVNFTRIHGGQILGCRSPRAQMIHIQLRAPAVQ